MSTRTPACSEQPGRRSPSCATDATRRIGWRRDDTGTALRGGHVVQGSACRCFRDRGHSCWCYLTARSDRGIGSASRGTL